MTDKVPQVSEQAAKLLEDLRGLLEKGGQFVMEQAPPLAKEIIAYGRAYHTIVLLLSVATAITCWVMLSRRGKAWIEWCNDNDCPHIGFFVTIIPGIVSTIATLFSIEGVCKVWFAPRLYLLDYIMSALK